MRVEDFPDLLPLQNSNGDAIGLFSDHGSWLAVTWKANSQLEIRDTCNDQNYALDLGSPLESTTSFADRQNAHLQDGRSVTIAFDPDARLLIYISGDDRPQPNCELPHQVHQLDDGNWCVQFPPADPPPADLLDQNRARWNAYFQAAFQHLVETDNPTHQLLLARAVTTLLWNHRRPIEELNHHGVIPSPFSYRGYWAWDSWKHAHALATFAPNLAAEQLRVQFSRQRDDGMVPDTVMPRSGDDNWLNTKPPLAAWALLEHWQQNKDGKLVNELYDSCRRQLNWWNANRQVNDEPLFRAGGVDYETATWDTGWDLCRRFDNVTLEDHGDWKLFDLWQPDINAFILNEYRSMALLAEAIDADANDWKRQHFSLTHCIRADLWDQKRGFYADVRPSTGQSTGVHSAASFLPIYAGAFSSKQLLPSVAALRSPQHFATPMPFPTLAAHEPGFDPDDYWSGGVWIDHAAWMDTILVHTDPVTSIVLRKSLLSHLAALPSLYECYSPLTGQPVQGNRPAVAQFSWTAAAVVRMLATGPQTVSEEQARR